MTAVNFTLENIKAQNDNLHFPSENFTREDFVVYPGRMGDRGGLDWGATFTRRQVDLFPRNELKASVCFALGVMTF